MNDQIRMLFEAGQSYSQIGRRLGVTTNVVAGRCRLMGLRRSGSPHPLVEPTPVEPTQSAFFSPKQRELYLDLQRAVLNTGGRR